MPTAKRPKSGYGKKRLPGRPVPPEASKSGVIQRGRPNAKKVKRKMP
jgi:hypothetical protein